ncbi:MAG: hypothetical protein AAF914_08340 [Pseudomonadota bacterium]
MTWTPGLALAIVLIGSAAVAQAPVAEADVDGRPVTLFADGTWSFDIDIAPGTCREIAVPISFCADDGRWQLLPIAGAAAIDAQFRLDDRTYAAVIVESVGGIDGVSIDSVERTARQALAGRGRVEIEDVPVLHRYDDRIGQTDLRTIVYAGRIDGVPHVFANSILVQDRMTAQLVTYAVEASYSDAHRAAHADFLARLRIDGAEAVE